MIWNPSSYIYGIQCGFAPDEREITVIWNPSSYIYGIQSGLFIKIGYARNIADRLRQFQLCNPHPCKVVLRRGVDPAYAKSAEMRAHDLLKAHAIGREWFMTDAASAREAVGQAIREMRDREVERVRYFCEKHSIRALAVRLDKNGNIINA